MKVTLIQRSEHVLKEFDVDAGREIEKVFRAEGIQIFTGTKLLGAGRKGKLKTVTYEHNGKKTSISAEEILFALGRAPNTEFLNLAAAGVKTENGRIVTNLKINERAAHFCGGRLRGLHDIVHIAVTQGEVAAHNIANTQANQKMDYRLLISAVWSTSWPKTASSASSRRASPAKCFTPGRNGRRSRMEQGRRPERRRDATARMALSLARGSARMGYN